MKRVQPINEIIRARINKCSDESAKKFINTVRPIYGASINGNPIHIGSCMLLQIDNKKYIVTALMELNDELVKKIGHNDYHCEDDILINDLNPKGRCYLALGYPVSKNKKLDTFKKSVKPYYLKYTSTIVPDKQLCEKLKITGDHHYFLSFDPKKSKDSNPKQKSAYRGANTII